MEGTAAVFMSTDDLIYAHPHLFPLSLSVTVIMTPPPPLSSLYISLIEAISSFRSLCSLFIDALRHSDHTVLMLQSMAIINPLCIKPDF